jgi:hypothetical protein
MIRKGPGIVRYAILAGLSLAALLYVPWFLMRHYRGYAGVNEPFSHWNYGLVKVYDCGTALAISFPASFCTKCLRSHFSFLACQSTIATFLNRQKGPSDWGPFSWALATGGFHYLFFEYWLPLVAFGAVPCTVLVHRLVRKRRQSQNHCAQCDYDLTGNISGVCPECGEAIPNMGKANLA